MIRVALTGGIGSGKTTFMNVWKDLGAHVLNADDFARELMVTDEEIIQQLKDVFGEETYKQDGSLNKEHLIEEAFSKGRVSELNAVVHPRLRIRTKEYADQIESSSDTEVFLYEAAVLLNEGRPDGFDAIIILLADQESRIKRVAERDSVKRSDITERIEAQPDFAAITHLADYIIENNESLDALKTKADKLFKKIKQELG